MNRRASKIGMKESKSKLKKAAKQPDPFYDPNKELSPTCDFCNEPPKKPPLFNKNQFPFTTSTTSASWEGGTCCIRVHEIDVSVVPPEDGGDIGVATVRRWPKRRKWVYKTPSDLERERERDYQYTLKRTLEDEKWERRLGFQRLQRKKRQLGKGVGPAWYQELSYKQMECIDLLGGAIAADMEEGIISRTQQLLARLGILPRPTYDQVAKAMGKCGLNPIIFLIYLYKYTTLVEDECMEPDSPYSINDRLLLSGLAHLALPMTLFDLNCRITPPPPAERIKKQKAKPGVKQEVFTSPYLEPQPICLYNGLMDEEIERERKRIAKKGGFLKEDEDLPEISDDDLEQATVIDSLETSSSSMGQRNGPRFGVDIKKSSAWGMMGKPSTFSVAMFENAMRQVGGGLPSEDSTSTVSAMPERDRKSLYLQNQLDAKISITTKERLENMYLNEDRSQLDRDLKESEEEREIKSEIPVQEHFTKIKLSNQSDTWFGSDDDSAEDLRNKKAKKTTPDKTKQKPAIKKKAASGGKMIIPEIIITFAPDQPELDYDNYPYVFDENYEYQYKKVNERDKLPGAEDDKPQEPVCDCARARADASERNKSMPKTTLSTESNGLHFTESDLLPCPILTIPTLQAAFIGYWSGVHIPSESFGMSTKSLESLLRKTESINEQVEVALEIMARQGNILASLPQVESLPALKHWIRSYKGFKLTPEIKAKLMKQSYGLWGQIQQHPSTVPIPSLHLKNPSKLNWNCKHWLMDKVNSMFHKYYSDVRKAQVDDARVYWCTMGMDYFKNPEFRNVYYTYLASKEDDVLAIRPWDGTTSK